jgi:hypothetical protein
MDLDRRGLLAGGLAYVGLAGLPYTVATGDPAIDQGPHPFTRTLLERTVRAGSALDRSKVERFIRQRRVPRPSTATRYKVAARPAGGVRPPVAARADQPLADGKRHVLAGGRTSGDG